MENECPIIESAAFARFEFRHPFYNPTGDLSASEYRLPCPEAGADIVLLVSVFDRSVKSPLLCIDEK
jgi:hypothetical protein